MRTSRIVRASLGALVVVGALAVAGIVVDHSKADAIAHGVRVAGVDVGGMSRSEAQAVLARRIGGALSRPVRVEVAGRTFTLGPRAARLHISDPATLASRAVAVSRDDAFPARLGREVFGGSVRATVPVASRYSTAAVDRFAARIAAVVDRPARDASVKPSASGLREVSSRTGRSVDRAALVRSVSAALERLGSTRVVHATAVRVKPKVTRAQLAAKYPAYIIVDRADFVLRFYRHLQLSRTYPIAVGMQGLETPPGLYDVQWKQTNPSWYVPNSAWAGKLAGRVIPPGPDDPIKARWMAFNGGAGIHGIDPSEYGSIGHNASHGCVRMRIPDVIDLYARTPVHTPVFVA